MCAVELASQMQLKNLVIEGDSKNCIDAMTNKSKLVHWRIANFSMRSDCYMQDLSCWSLIGCTRIVAHVLAMWSLSDSFASYFAISLQSNMLLIKKNNSNIH